jgi:hypothetical protein
LRNTPTRLCRLRHFSEDRWGFAFCTFSDEKYRVAVYDDGEFYGMPEDAFRISANAYRDRMRPCVARTRREIDAPILDELPVSW